MCVCFGCSDTFVGANRCNVGHWTLSLGAALFSVGGIRGVLVELYGIIWWRLAVFWRYEGKVIRFLERFQAERTYQISHILSTASFRRSFWAWMLKMRCDLYDEFCMITEDGWQIWCRNEIQVEPDFQVFFGIFPQFLTVYYSFLECLETGLYDTIEVRQDHALVEI